MKKYVMDIEANGLLDSVDKIWMIVLKPITKDEFIVFSDEAEEGKPISEFPEWVDNNCDLLIAHNGVRYDLEVLYRLLGWSPKCKVHDTMIMSKLNCFIRQDTNRRHSLKAWGESLGEFKDDYDGGFDEYSDEMLEYCKQDCVVTEKIYVQVLKEFRERVEMKPNYKVAMQTEHELSKYSAQQTRNGWLFDFEGAQALIDEITDKMQEIENEIEPHLEDRVIFVDKEPKTPSYNKDGRYTAATARMLSEFLGYAVCQEDALRAKPPMQAGESYQRTQEVPGVLGNQDIVKDYLIGLGWKPDEWNWKNLNGKWVKMSPKFTEKSLLEVQHPHAEGINEYYTLRQRKSVLQGWMDQADADGRLRGDVNDMGAASFRQTHRIIANIPGANAKYGKEIRSLFKVPEGKTLISADGAAYQVRLLAHFLKDVGYINTVLNGDVHQLHADRVGVSRGDAKGLFFATLFGAGGAKIGRMLGTDQKDGSIKRNKLLNGIPNMRRFLGDLENYVNAYGYVPSPDGRKIFPESNYKALNYLIQGTEACAMKLTVVRINQAFEEAGIDAIQLLMYHDECTWEIPEDKVEEAEEIIRHWFAEAPKEIGIQILEAGDVKTGSNYYEVH